MRPIIIQYLTQQAERDPSIFLIVGDLGFSFIEPFKERFPNRFINAGIAEQNMIGIAAGLAMAGHNVYVYSIIPFLTMRCFEQIRNDLCYQNLPVKLIGNGSGFTYATDGITHQGLEDLSLMRALPNMTIVAPGSKNELEQLMPALHALPGPAYLCLGNIENLVTYPAQTTVTLGKATEIVPHATQSIIATGNALDLAWQTQQQLQEQGISIGLVSMPTIKPLDIDFLASRPWQALFTIDEHMINGGLGEGVARFLCEHMAHKVMFQTFGIDDVYFHQIGNRAYLKEKAGLCKDAIATAITKKLCSLTYSNT
jgi:transketolase